jgi:transcription elongation factor Elf1
MKYFQCPHCGMNLMNQNLVQHFVENENEFYCHVCHKNYIIEDSEVTEEDAT